METGMNVNVETAKNGCHTLKVFHENKELYLHSKYNPMREAEIWAAETYEKGKMFVLIGLGLGYYAKALLTKLGEQDQILIIEPHKQIFDKAVEAGLSEIFEDKRVFLCLENDREKLGQILRILILEQRLKNSKIIISPNYEKICSTNMIVNNLKKAFIDYAVDINTKLNQASGWQQNYLKNIIWSMKSCPITEFENRFKCPVVIVGAGPSLNKELENLKNIYGQALIISSGTASTVLIKNNVRPHVIVSIDGHIANYNHFKEVNYKGIPLFYSPNSQYKIVEEHEGHKVVFQWSGVDVSDWYDELIGFQTGIIKVGPSVANFALDIAYKMTSGPICFIGQDLGFAGGYSHAEGNINRIKVDDVKRSSLMRIESNDGSELYTDYSFTLMREWFENYLEMYPRSNVFNATLSGAKIKGTQTIQFEKFISEYCNSPIHVTQMIDDIIADWQQKHRTENIRTDKIFHEMLVCLNQVIKLTQKARSVSDKILNKVKNNDHNGIDRLLIKLTVIDDKITDLKGKDGVLYFIMQTVNDILALWDEEDRNEHKKRIKIAEKSCFFYKKIYEMSSEVRKMLQDMEAGGTHG